MPVTFCSSGQKQGQSLTTPHAFWPKQVQAGNCHLYECMPLHSLISRFTTRPIFTTCIWFGICCSCSPRQHQFDCLSTNAIHFSSSCHPYPATAVDLKVLLPYSSYKMAALTHLSTCDRSAQLRASTELLQQAQITVQTSCPSVLYVQLSQPGRDTSE